MPIQALRAVSGEGGIRFHPTAIKTDRAADLEPLTSPDQPTVYVLRNRDLEPLTRYSERVNDRGTKHKAKPLARLLLGREGIPLIRGTYTSASQMVRSLRALLRHAEQQRESKAFLVGADSAVYEELRERAPANAAAPRKEGRAPAPRARTRWGAIGEAEYLLELLPGLEVPADLHRRFVGTSAEAQLVRKLTLLAAKSEEPVLLRGDTGTGKEVVARCIHDYGERRIEPFVPVNCSAIPSDLFESELFGHVRGAFTTAHYRKDGLWKVAGRGTLFLDEIGDLRLDHQAKILRALQEEKIRPVGSDHEIAVKPRVIAASNRDIYAMVKAGQFREDLYYRLRALLITTPSLNDHPQDIPLLASFFWQAVTGDTKADLPDPFVTALQRHSWPGNARELRAVLASVHALFGKHGIDVVHLNAIFQLEGRGSESALPAPGAFPVDTRRLEQSDYLERVEDIIRACRVALEPIATLRRVDPRQLDRISAGLRRRLVELEITCDPRLFPNEESFAAAHELLGKLAYFETMLEDEPWRARAYWKKTLAGELDATEFRIAEQIERLQADL